MPECPACGFDNPSEARFCGRCGAALGEVIVCPGCGAANLRGNLYCNECGQRLDDATEVPSSSTGVWPDRRAFVPESVTKEILAARGQLPGERKQVTVLFADVVGSTQLAKRSGPERWQQIVERFFAIICEGVHRFDGIIDRFTGDGAMAVFGAPLGDEQHALHGCHAALELSEQLAGLSAQLRREHGLNLLVRLGLNSGEVVVGAIGEDLDIKYTAVGHTVALAKRMEGLAEPGKIYLTEGTAREVEGYFEARYLGEFDVRGVEDRVRVFELAGLGRLRTALEHARAHGLSRFVGRDDEMRALASALARVREGNGQAVCVVGEAGVGKSRLLYEFSRRCGQEQIEVWEGHCRARGETLALMPLLELLRSYFGLGERDAGAAARQRIAGRVLQRVPSLNDQLPLLFDLLGVADRKATGERVDPGMRQRRLFAMVNRIFAVSSKRSAMVLVLEDLQWIDPASAAFLSNLIDALPGTRMLVLASSRPPPYQADWMQRSYCARLLLAPLAGKPARGLLADLLGDDPSLAALAEQLAQRAGGNPFFSEELVRALVEDGNLVGDRGAYRLVGRIDQDAIPSTVQALIAARIDRLPEREKRLLQTAAVIGRDFPEPVLATVAGVSASDARAALRGLLDGELVYQRAFAPEPAYSFAHQLTADVAYRSQLRDSRRQLHSRVAGVLEERYPERLDELAALISHHHEQAGDPLAAARWGVRAAMWAGSANPTGALRQWRRAIELTDEAPESPEAVSIGIWSRIAIMDYLSRLHPDAREIKTIFARARDLAQRSGDVRSQAFVLEMYAYTRTLAGEIAASIDMHLESLRLADEAADPLLRVALFGATTALFLAGRWREALAVIAPALELIAKDPALGAGLIGESADANYTFFAAEIRLYLGELTVQEAIAEHERALALALERGGLEGACLACTAHVGACWIEGNGEAGLKPAQQAVELAERMGSFSSQAHAYSSLGLAHILRGEWTEAIADEQHSLDVIHAHTQRSVWEPMSLAELSLAYSGAGDRANARSTAERAIALAVAAGSLWMELVGQISLVRALTDIEAARESDKPATGAESAIEAVLSRIEGLIEQMGARGYEPFLHEARARFAQLTGDTSTYTHELHQAQQQWSAIGAHPRAATLSAELAPAAS